MQDSKPFQATTNQSLSNKHSNDYLKKLTKTFTPSPSIYEQIISQSKQHPVRLLIAHTLLYLPSLCFPVFLKTQPNGVVSIDTSKNSLSNFFEEKYTYPSESQPKYIHIAMNERIKLCSTEREAKTIFEDCPHFTHRLHRYIQTNSSYASKIRVHWKAHKPPTTYIVTNKLPIHAPEELPPTIIGTSSNGNTLNSVNITLASTREKNGLGKVKGKAKVSTHLQLPKLKSTQSSSNLSKSRLETSTYSIYIDDIRLQDYRKYFVQVKGTTENYITLSNRYYPELQETLKLVLGIISSNALKNMSPAQEVLIDFMKNMENKWVLLGCKGYKVRGQRNVEVKIEEHRREPSTESFLSRKHSVFLCESVSEESLKSEISSESDDESARIDKVADRLKLQAAEMSKYQHQSIGSINNEDYLKLKQSDELGRIPYVMIGIMPHRIGNPVTYFIERTKDAPIKPNKYKDRAKNLLWAGSDKMNPEQYAKIISKNLNSISKIYNNHRYQGAVGRDYIITKSKISKILIEKGSAILQAIKEFLSKIDKSASYSMFFENRTESEISHISTQIFESLNPASELNLRDRLRVTHRGLGIHFSVFTDFTTNLVNSIKIDADLLNDQADSIAKRLKSLEKDIIS